MSDSDSSLSAYEAFSRKKNNEGKGSTSSVPAGRKRPLINFDDSSDNDSLLNFTKHRFTPTSASKTSKSKSSKNDTSIDVDSDSDDSVLKNMKVGKSLRSAKKSLKNDTGDDSDSDNDVLGGDKAKSTRTNKPLGTTVISAAASKAKLDIHMDSDDSDDDVAGPRIQIKESEAMKMARLAREALLHANAPIDMLDDDYDDDDGLDVGMEYVPIYNRKPQGQPLSFSSVKQMNSDAVNFAAYAAKAAANIATIAATFTATTSTVATGPMIRLQFRSSIKTAPTNHGGKSLHSKSITLPFRTGTKMEQVMQSYRQRVNPQITSLAQVKFVLDGLTMDLQKSLQTYDLEDEDMIDVSIFIPPNAPPSEKVTTAPAVAPASTATATSTTKRAMLNSNPTSMAEYVQIKTRIKNGDPSKTHIFQLKSHDSFSKLLKAYRAMHNYSSFKRILLEYNGSTVEEDKTPSDVLAMSLTSKNELEMEICDEQERVKQVHMMPQASRNGGSSSNGLDNGHNDAGAGNSSTINGSVGGISLKIRVNGNDKQCEQYSILLKEHFQTMIDWFCTKHGVLQKDCQFIFDGCPLNPKGNAEEEDLEGGEVIDVKVDKNLLEKGKLNGVSASVSSASTASSSVGGSEQSSSMSTSAAKIHKVALSGRLGVNIGSFDNRIRIRNVTQANRKDVFFPGDLIKSLNGKEIIGISPPAFALLMNKGENEVNDMEIVRMGMSDMETAALASPPITATVRTARSISTTPSSNTAATSALPSASTTTRSAITKRSTTTARTSTGTSSTLDTASTSTLTPTFTSTERRVISVQVVRNNANPSKPRKFRLYSDYALSKLRSGYLAAYKKGGCKRVTFYLRGAALTNDSAAIGSLNLTDSDLVIAMENGKVL